MDAADLDAIIADLVDEFPPLTPEQREQIATAFRSVARRSDTAA